MQAIKTLLWEVCPPEKIRLILPVDQPNTSHRKIAASNPSELSDSFKEYATIILRDVQSWVFLRFRQIMFYVTESLTEESALSAKYIFF